MRTVHNSRNLTIDYDKANRRFVVTVTFHEESISGSTEAHCPRCDSHSHVSMWELEGPGGDSNLMWLTCAGDPPCLIDDEVLRWAVEVTFDGDWEDL